MPDSKANLVSARDFLQAATLLVLVPVSLFAPIGRWPQSCRTIAGVASKFRITHFSDIAAALATFEQQEEDGADLEDRYRRCLGMTFENRLQIVDQNLFKRWQPKISVTGMGHLKSAVDAGRGAVLWVSPFAFSDLVVKIGLAQAGCKIAHLSRPQHGFSETVIGMATLNRLRTRVEDRYLHERVRIDTNTEKRAMLSLRRIVKNNGIVTITVGSLARNPDSVSLAHGDLQIAIGAIRLARMTNAPLIPVFGVKSAELDYCVHIESPIDTSGSETKSSLRQYADVLHRYIKRYPYQWRGTSDFSLPEERSETRGPNSL